MESAGWEIKPAGWIALILLAAVTLWFVIQRQQNTSDDTQTNSVP